MKHGLLVTSPISDHKNIGDYIQSLAALQFTEKVDVYLEKEEISRDINNAGRVKAIMNAWYIWHPENWPPNKKIVPLLTSIHISPLTAEAMVKGDKINYLIENGPVGCRDLATFDFLKSKDVPSYFSGCLTLTLGKKYGADDEGEGIVFVDPYVSPLRVKAEGRFIYNFINPFKAMIYFLKSPATILKLSKKLYFRGRLRLMKYYNSAMFYNAYKKKFTKDALLSAKFVTHMVGVKGDELQEDLLGKAEDLVRIYSKAGLVVTSRIHCALPCLGLETPVIFVLNEQMKSEKNLFNAPGRFGGITDFFRTMTYSTDRLMSNDDVLSNFKLIDSKTRFTNKSNFFEYRDNLARQCEEFMADSPQSSVND